MKKQTIKILEQIRNKDNLQKRDFSLIYKLVKLNRKSPNQYNKLILNMKGYDDVFKKLKDFFYINCEDWEKYKLKRTKNEKQNEK